MFIEPDVIKTATIMLCDDERIGSAFFVRIPLGGGLRSSAYYVVTAGHVVADKKKPASIRFPFVDGGSEDRETLWADWIRSPTTDVAVYPLGFSLDRYDLKFICGVQEYYTIMPATIQFAVHKDHLASVRRPYSGGMAPFLRYDVGDEVYSIGLFEQDRGPELSKPVVRFGHIAFNPAEGEKLWAEFDDNDFRQIDAFLIEMAAWGGQSGSPIFLRPFAENKRGQSKPEFTALVGMLQGLYPGEQKVEINQHEASISGISMGIGIVIPARDIQAALMHDDLKEQRRKMLEEALKQQAGKPKSA